MSLFKSHSKGSLTEQKATASSSSQGGGKREEVTKHEFETMNYNASKSASYAGPNVSVYTQSGLNRSASGDKNTY